MPMKLDLDLGSLTLIVSKESELRELAVANILKNHVGYQTEKLRRFIELLQHEQPGVYVYTGRFKRGFENNQILHDLSDSLNRLLHERQRVVVVTDPAAWLPVQIRELTDMKIELRLFSMSIERVHPIDSRKWFGPRPVPARSDLA